MVAVPGAAFSHPNLHLPSPQWLCVPVSALSVSGTLTHIQSSVVAMVVGSSFNGNNLIVILNILDSSFSYT